MLHEAGVAARIEREGIRHSGFFFSDDDLMIRIDFHHLTGKRVMVYGQTEVTADLYWAQDAMGTNIIQGVKDVVINDATSSSPNVEFNKNGERNRLDCDYVVGCDGFHRVSRSTIPKEKRREFQRIYPFGWLGLLSRTPPANHELVYSNSSNGFALASMRNKNLSRYYVQVPVNDKVGDWSD